ncbi:hypothetical protein HOA55_01475 [archaeon]|jgi:hypothetical protein|nr:hypothetical protein [archaeon]MBT3578023.1 hypothetical protein [archaeon]MBT6820004.1 hypothetical protein [archaeon]MBT6955708.1 hypothetical protein [archaeon]MBT7025043.1 hypothetical protein [archaeon]
MKKLVLCFLFGLFLTVGVVSAIECSEADYDGDGDVDFMDVFQLRQCINISVSEVTAVNCSFFDYDDSGMVEENDLVKYREWSAKTCPVEPSCEDSDGGKDYYVKGAFSGIWDGLFIETTDSCLSSLDDSADNVLSSDYLGEGYCDGKTLKVNKIDCPNGCEDGACVVGTERVTCEIDYEKVFDNDVICSVQYNGTSAQCTIQADNDPYNICYPDPAINIEKPMPDEGYMPVPGLSGSFEGIQCDEIETAYNTNGFFVGCKFFDETEEEEVEEDISSCDSEGICILYVGGEVGSEPALSGNEISINNFYESGVELLLSRQEITNVLSEGDKYFNSEFEIIILEIDGDDKIKFDFNMLIDVESIPDIPIGESECDNGCSLNEKCFNFGYRKAIDGDLKYCFENGNWTEQKGADESCDNSFECDSNLCVDGECVSAGFFKRMMNWFAKWFS